MNDYLALTKPRITWLILMSTGVGYFFGLKNGWQGWASLIHTIVGTGLIASGTSALNQWSERVSDCKMRRTAQRPLPSGRLEPTRALIFSTGLAIAGFLELSVFVNLLSGLLGLFTLASYLFLYTPLKTRTHWCTFIGAIPGALPPLLGWAAARNHVGIEAWTLFGILFFWQFPHFHAIATMYREDYGRARIRMLPVVEPDGRSTARQIVGYTVGLVVISLLPVLLGLSGWVYLAGAVLLGAWFLHASLMTARQMTQPQARRLLKVSVIYLPLLLGLMVLNR